MIAAGLDVFDRTLHETHEWLADLMRRLAVGDRQVAYQALRATLHALRDRLTVEEVAQPGAQLPMLVRGFLAYVASEFSNGDVDPEPAARAVFALPAERVTAGEIDDVKHILPAELRELWP
jgi:uncharacterized protein (DUF2267 family)